MLLTIISAKIFSTIIVGLRISNHFVNASQELDEYSNMNKICSICKKGILVNFNIPVIEYNEINSSCNKRILNFENTPEYPNMPTRKILSCFVGCDFHCHIDCFLKHPDIFDAHFENTNAKKDLHRGLIKEVYKEIILSKNSILYIQPSLFTEQEVGTIIFRIINLLLEDPSNLTFDEMGRLKVMLSLSLKEFRSDTFEKSLELRKILIDSCKKSVANTLRNINKIRKNNSKLSINDVFEWLDKKEEYKNKCLEIELIYSGSSLFRSVPKLLYLCRQYNFTFKNAFKQLCEDITKLHVNRIGNLLRILKIQCERTFLDFVSFYFKNNTKKQKKIYFKGFFKNSKKDYYFSNTIVDIALFHLCDSTDICILSNYKSNLISHCNECTIDLVFDLCIEKKLRIFDDETILALNLTKNELYNLARYLAYKYRYSSFEVFRYTLLSPIILEEFNRSSDLLGKEEVALVKDKIFESFYMNISFFNAALNFIQFHNFDCAHLLLMKFYYNKDSGFKCEELIFGIQKCLELGYHESALKLFNLIKNVTTLAMVDSPWLKAIAEKIRFEINESRIFPNYLILLMNNAKILNHLLSNSENPDINMKMIEILNLVIKVTKKSGGRLVNCNERIVTANYMLFFENKSIDTEEKHDSLLLHDTSSNYQFEANSNFSRSATNDQSYTSFDHIFSSTNSSCVYSAQEDRNSSSFYPKTTSFKECILSSTPNANYKNSQDEDEKEFDLSMIDFFTEAAQHNSNESQNSSNSYDNAMQLTGFTQSINETSRAQKNTDGTEQHSFYQHCYSNDLGFPDQTDGIEVVIPQSNEADSICRDIPRNNDTGSEELYKNILIQENSFFNTGIFSEASGALENSNWEDNIDFIQAHQ